MACKEAQLDVVELMVNDQFKTFSINLNAQHVYGMTPFDLAYICTAIRYSRVGRSYIPHHECAHSGSVMLSNSMVFSIILFLGSRPKRILISTPL